MDAVDYVNRHSGAVGQAVHFFYVFFGNIGAHAFVGLGEEFFEVEFLEGSVVDVPEVFLDFVSEKGSVLVAAFVGGSLDVENADFCHHSVYSTLALESISFSFSGESMTSLRMR